MSEKITITIWMAGRGYKLKVEPHKEQAIRKASQIAEKKMNELKMHFQGKALCLLMYVTDQVAEDVQLNITQESTITEIIASIDEIIEE